MKCNQSRPGFELVSLCPFPTTITITPWARWVCDTLTGKAHVNTKAASKMLVKQCFGTLPALVEEYMLMMDITLLKSCQNCTDSLTRVPQRWLDLHKKVGEPMPESCAVVTSQLSKSQVADIQQRVATRVLRGHCTFQGSST